MMIQKVLVAASFVVGLSTVSLAATHGGECIVNGKADAKISQSKCTGAGKVWKSAKKEAHKDAVKSKEAPVAPAAAPATEAAPAAEGETK